MDLKGRFYDVLAHRYTDTELIASYWNELKEQYNQNFRAYHNMQHLTELFSYYDTYLQELKHPTEVAYAIFYHDSIYSIWRKDNELKSAKLAEKCLMKASIAPESIARIYALIMATKSHQPNNNEDEKWMIDFDLAILGQPWETYLQYTQNIRKEYSAVPSLLYKGGRKKVLHHFMEKTQIYQTPTFIGLYEKQARINLQKELEIL